MNVRETLQKTTVLLDSGEAFDREDAIWILLARGEVTKIDAYAIVAVLDNTPPSMNERDTIDNIVAMLDRPTAGRHSYGFVGDKLRAAIGAVVLWVAVIAYFVSWPFILAGEQHERHGGWLMLQTIVLWFAIYYLYDTHRRNR